jgi:uncharacterized protein (DUF1015 family)
VSSIFLTSKTNESPSLVDGNLNSNEEITRLSRRLEIEKSIHELWIINDEQKVEEIPQLAIIERLLLTIYIVRR